MTNSTLIDRDDLQLVQIISIFLLLDVFVDRPAVFLVGIVEFFQVIRETVSPKIIYTMSQTILQFVPKEENEIIKNHTLNGDFGGEFINNLFDFRLINSVDEQAELVFTCLLCYVDQKLRKILELLKIYLKMSEFIKIRYSY
jgi:hypothetical protein